MEYSKKLQNAIHEQNVVHARTAILSYLDADENNPSPQALRIAIEISEKFTDLQDPFFDEEDHILEIPPQKTWNRSLLIKIKAALLTNFSREKLELAEQVISFLKHQNFQNSNDNSAISQETNTLTNVRQNIDNYQANNEINKSPEQSYKKPQIIKQNNNKKRSNNTTVESAIIGGFVFGGIGAIVGLVAHCIVKATVTGIISGIVIGGITRKIIDQNFNK